MLGSASRLGRTWSCDLWLEVLVVEKIRPFHFGGPSRGEGNQNFACFCRIYLQNFFKFGVFLWPFFKILLFFLILDLVLRKRCPGLFGIAEFLVPCSIPRHSASHLLLQLHQGRVHFTLDSPSPLGSVVLRFVCSNSTVLLLHIPGSTEIPPCSSSRPLLQRHSAPLVVRKYP